MSQNLPTDPLTPFLSAGIGMYELFKAYREGGFTEDQALKLIAMGIAEQARVQRDNAEGEQ
jgi:hypothetical protein